MGLGAASIGATGAVVGIMGADMLVMKFLNCALCAGFVLTSNCGGCGCAACGGAIGPIKFAMPIPYGKYMEPMIGHSSNFDNRYSSSFFDCCKTLSI
jgi:hypothetical protein